MDSRTVTSDVFHLIMLPFMISLYLPYFTLALNGNLNQQMGSADLSSALIEEYGTSLVWIYLLMFAVSRRVVSIVLRVL